MFLWLVHLFDFFNPGVTFAQSEKAFWFSDVTNQEVHFDLPALVEEDEDEILRAIAMSLEKQSRVDEE